MTTINLLHEPVLPATTQRRNSGPPSIRVRSRASFWEELRSQFLLLLGLELVINLVINGLIYLEVRFASDGNLEDPLCLPKNQWQVIENKSGVRASVSEYSAVLLY